MNPIIVNNESYFQFTMKRNSVPTSAAVAFSSTWDYQRKKVTMGKDAQGKQTPKGDGMFANRTPIAKHQPTDGANRTPARRRKAGEPSAHVPKKWSSSAELLHLSCGLSIQFPRHPVLRIFHFEARIG